MSLRNVIHKPPREKRRESKFWKHHEFSTLVVGITQERYQSFYAGFSRVVSLYRTHLSRGNGDDSCHTH
jgi:hypothetical protein